MLADRLSGLCRGAETGVDERHVQALVLRKRNGGLRRRAERRIEGLVCPSRIAAQMSIQHRVKECDVARAHRITPQPSLRLIYLRESALGLVQTASHHCGCHQHLLTVNSPGRLGGVRLRTREPLRGIVIAPNEERVHAKTDSWESRVAVRDDSQH